MPDRERAVVIFGKSGRTLFSSPRCRITDNPNGSYTITDLSTDGPTLMYFDKQWNRVEAPL